MEESSNPAKNESSTTSTATAATTGIKAIQPSFPWGFIIDLMNF